MTTTPGNRFSGLTGAFRLVAYIEAATFLVLLAAVFVKRVLDGPENLVSVFGPIHGIAFLVYLYLVLRIREGQRWGLGATIVVILASAVPFGGFWAGRHLTEPEPSGAPQPG